MPSIPESGATHHADQEIVRPDAAMNRRSESESASDDTSRTDTAPPSPTRRESSGVRAAGPVPGTDAPMPSVSDYDASMPAQSAASRSTSEHPVPEQPAPGLVERPGPEAEI